MFCSTHSTHFIYSYYGVGDMEKDQSDSESGNHYMGYSFRLAARVLL